MRRVRTHPPRQRRSSWAGLLCALLVLCARGHAGGAEPPPEAQLAVAWVTPRSEVYVGEVLHLTLRVRVHEPWLVEHGAPFARQPMDLPLHVRAPALRPSARLTPVPEPPRASLPRVTFALDDAVVEDAHWGGLVAAGEGKGEPARTVERWLTLRRAFHVRGLGPLTLEAPEVDVVWAKRFQTGLLGERLPVEPRRATARGEPLSLTVLPLPTAGRPAGFEGWIGRYTLTTDAHPTTIAAGERLRVTLTIAGQGNHAVLPAPRLEPPEGMHVAGRLEERTPEGWIVRFELEPAEATTTSVVGFAMEVFEPEQAEYVRVESPAQRVHVERPARAPPPATPSPASPPPAPEEGSGASPWRTWLPLGALALFLGLAARRRRREAEEAAPAEEAAAARSASCERLLETAGTPTAGAALVEALARHLDVPPAAVIAPDLARRLGAMGLDPSLADEAARAIEADVAARYAGPASATTSAVSPDLARRLTEALAAREARDA